MMLRNAVPASARFSHLSRTLRPGEGIPPLPSMFQQLSACRQELRRRQRWEEEQAALTLAEADIDDDSDE